MLGLAFIVFFGITRFDIQFLITALLALILFMVAIINTDAALIFLIFSMLLSPEFVIGKVPGREIVIRADDIFILIIFIGWLAKMAINKELGMLRSSPLNRPILVYIIVVTFSTFIGVLFGYQKSILRSLIFILKYIEYYFLFFMVLNNIKNMKQVKLFVSAMLLVCFIVAVFAMWMYFAGYGRVSAPFEGPEGEPNTLAGYLILMGSITTGLILFSEILAQKMLLSVFLMFLVPPFLYTLSRGGWAGFFPMYLSLIFYSRRAKLALIAIFLIGIVFFPFIAPKEVKYRFLETFTPYKYYEILGQRVSFDESFSTRIDTWSETFKRFWKSPIVGFGVPARLVIDNQYAQLLEESGAIGFVTFMWLIFLFFRLARKAYNDTIGDNFAQGLSLGYLVNLFCMLTMSFVSAIFIVIRVMEPFWFLTAIMVKLPELVAAEKAPQPAGTT